MASRFGSLPLLLHALDLATDAVDLLAGGVGPATDTADPAAKWSIPSGRMSAVGEGLRSQRQEGRRVGAQFILIFSCFFFHLSSVFSLVSVSWFLWMYILVKLCAVAPHEPPAVANLVQPLACYV